MVKTTKLVAAMRCSSQAPTSSPPCATCAYRVVELLDGKEYTGCDCDRMWLDAADKSEELVERCARYAEEIAVLREKQKWVDAKERQPEYGVSVLAVASGKAANITLRDAITFATFWDSWELDDYPQAKDVVVKWWRPMVKSPEVAKL